MRMRGWCGLLWCSDTGLFLPRRAGREAGQARGAERRLVRHGYEVPRNVQCVLRVEKVPTRGAPYGIRL